MILLRIIRLLSPLGGLEPFVWLICRENDVLKGVWIFGWYLEDIHSQLLLQIKEHLY